MAFLKEQNRGSVRCVSRSGPTSKPKSKAKSNSFVPDETKANFIAFLREEIKKPTEVVFDIPQDLTAALIEYLVEKIVRPWYATVSNI